MGCPAVQGLSLLHGWHLLRRRQPCPPPPPAGQSLTLAVGSSSLCPGPVWRAQGLHLLLEQASPHRVSPTPGMYAKLPQGHPHHPVPAVGTRFLQLSEHPAGERGASSLFLAASSVSGVSWDLLCLILGVGQEGVVPTRQRHVYPHSPSIFLQKQGRARSERLGAAPGGRAGYATSYYAAGKVPGPSLL